MNFNFFRDRSVAIDLGNNNTLVHDRERMLLTQPSYIVFDTANHRVKAVGDRAFDIFEKHNEAWESVKPLRGGVIADYDSATQMIRELLNQANASTSYFNRYDQIISGIPYCTTEVERRALRDALSQFNARYTHLLYEPLAAAMGLGLAIQEPTGKLVVDIGGGITEIVIISLSGIAAFKAVKIGGDAFDVAIQDYFRREYTMAIGLKTAEQIKIQVGAVVESLEVSPQPMLVKGKDLMEGIPVTRLIDHIEVSRILDKLITTIENLIIQTLEVCPPELAADIYLSGVYVTGGNAQLRGLKERFSSTLKLPVHIDAQPMHSVAKGIAMSLNNPKKYRSVLV